MPVAVFSEPGRDPRGWIISNAYARIIATALTAVQKVQKTILIIRIFPANNRRKIRDYMVETDENTQGAGHRPAKLYRRKKHDAHVRASIEEIIGQSIYDFYEKLKGR